MASGSPRRKEILANSGLNFEVIPSTFEENLDKSRFKDEPFRYAEETAKLKALEVFERLSKDSDESLIVIGSDTVVTLNEKIYEKPKSPDDAVQMLSELSGSSHRVYTGVCLKKKDNIRIFSVGTTVNFDSLASDVIKAYVASGEPMDKAGGYGIQAKGGTLIKGVEGDYFNVMGFPLNRFCHEFTAFVQ